MGKRTMQKKNDSKVLIELSKLIIPCILGLGVVGAVGFLLGTAMRIKYWPLVFMYFFPPLGKETVIPLGIASGIHPILMASSIAFVDIIVALFLVWNYDLAKRIPLIGSFMIKVEEKGHGIEDKYAWIRPLRFIGIVLFVMIPFQGSGGFVGSIVGRLIGMRPWTTFIAISTGAVTGCLLVATFSNIFIELAKINTVLTVILIVIIAVIITIYFAVKKLKKKCK